MKGIGRKIGIITTIILTGFLISIYFKLEDFFYSDFGCGCSSSCIGYYPTNISKIIGYILLISATLVFLASLWRIRGLSRWFTIPAFAVFLIAFYGNGYMLFNKVFCGLSINKTTFFIYQVKLGDFAKRDGESIVLDSLKAGRYNSKLLGFYLQGNNLTIYRIAEKPLKLKTSFLFWQTDNSRIRETLSVGLNTFRNNETEKIKNHYEFIGGQDMPLEAFLADFKITEKWLTGEIKNKILVKQNDGTTRLLIETE
jgi:hypothetical protein